MEYFTLLRILYRDLLGVLSQHSLIIGCLDKSVRFLNKFYKERNLNIYTFLLILFGVMCDKSKMPRKLVEMSLLPPNAFKNYILQCAWLGSNGISGIKTQF